MTLGANCEMGVRVTNARPGTRSHLVRLRRALLAPESLALGCAHLVLEEIEL